jgi:DNA-binding CsgD family transcriptional regulator
MGKHCYDVIAGGDHLGHPFCGSDCPVIECARKGRAPENYDVHTRKAAGTSCWINVSIIVLKGRTARSTIAVHLFRDVTTRRRGELELRQALSEAGAQDHERESIGGAAARLTRREAEVLQMLACGLDNRTIGETLGVSPTTVRNHIEHLLAKLGVHSKLEAVVYAARHRLV